MITMIRRAMYAAVLLSVVMLKTNPTFDQHHRTLSASSPVALTTRSRPLGRMLETPAEAEGGHASRYYGQELTRQDYRLFSVTSGGADGRLQSLGFLGCVFDLRDAEYLAAQEHAAAAARFEEVAEIVPQAAKPRGFGVSTENDHGELDYSSRGCEPEQK